MMILYWKWITALTLFMATIGCSQQETIGVKETASPAVTEATQSAPAEPTPETKNQETRNPENPDVKNQEVKNNTTQQTTASKTAEKKTEATGNPKPKEPEQQPQNYTSTVPATPNKSAPPTPVAGNTPKEASDVLQLVNKERVKNSLPPLAIDPLLQKAAMLKAQDMRDKNYFAHQSPTFGSPFDLMTKVGIHYSYAGENIAAGQRTSAEVMASWMNSSGHRANILNKNFSKIGIGFVTGGTYGVYWTQEFIRP